MNTPFIYGKLATGENFTNREKETNHLVQNFLSGTNTMLISPRRWGKSSLVLKSANEAFLQDKSIRIVMLDLFNVRSEEEFYKILSESVVRSVSGKMNEVIANVKKFMKQWIPKIQFSPDSKQEFSFSLDWKELKKQPDEILNLPESIAQNKGYKFVVCIDEFQNISYFEDPLAFQKKLRAHWQHHQSVCYCLYGSKRHMLAEVFSSPSMPFYKFGDLMLLHKITPEHWIPFITGRFEATGKHIETKHTEKLVTAVNSHPYYVQQLAQLVWFRTEDKVNDEITGEAIESLMLQMSLLFQSLTEGLSTYQVNFLKALTEGISSFSSKENLERFKLGSSANVFQVKKALIEKEIIDEFPEKIEILDPIYALWLKQMYFI
jgi:hypothetical protein